MIHTLTHKYHTRVRKTSTHKSMPNKPPHHLILKPLFSIDKNPWLYVAVVLLMVVANSTQNMYS
jgi:hypothetical protein